MAQPPALAGDHDTVVPSVVDASEVTWEADSDVIVVGFGAAGACTALEAHDGGATVRILDRFTVAWSTATSSRPT